MAFNFGAFLGGAATQITKDIDEEEKRVKLRMDKILDRQQELTIQNQKEFKAKKEKVQNQMNALVPLFGGGPNAIAKARSIVAGGDNHYNFMFMNLDQGMYEVKANFYTMAQVEASASCGENDGSDSYLACEADALEEVVASGEATAKAVIGNSMMTVQEVRAVKGEVIEM